MKNFNLLILIVLIFGCQTTRNLTDKLVLEQDVGIGQLMLYRSTIYDVEAIYGKDYKVIKWGKDSIENQYFSLGISFFYKQSDEEKIINFISLNPKKFKGQTDKRLRITSNIKIKDVIEVYGQPEWSYTSDSTELSADYEGISFYVEPERIFTKENYAFEQVNDSIHTDFYYRRKIISVSIPF